MPHLEKEGGHVGYAIRPSAHRNGFGTSLSRLTLEKAEARGLREVLVTCDRDNVGSARIIEKNGGQLIGRVIADSSGKEVERYRIVLGA